MILRRLATCAVGLALLLPAAVSAQLDVGDAGSILDVTVGQTGVEQQDVTTAIGDVIALLLSLVGIFFFIMMVYGGILWMTARGKEDQVDRARRTVVGTAIGLVVTVSGYAMTVLVSDTLLSGGTSAPDSAGENAEGVGFGCCFDKVQPREGTIDAPSVTEYWTWRITTYEDCETRGNDPDDSQDVLYGTQYWDFIDNFDAAQCENLFIELDYHRLLAS